MARVTVQGMGWKCRRLQARARRRNGTRPTRWQAVTPKRRAGDWSALNQLVHVNHKQRPATDSSQSPVESEMLVVGLCFEPPGNRKGEACNIILG